MISDLLKIGFEAPYKSVPIFHLNELLNSALTLLPSERPKLHTILAFLSAVGLRQ